MDESIWSWDRKHNAVLKISFPYDVSLATLDSVSRLIMGITYIYMMTMGDMVMTNAKDQLANRNRLSVGMVVSGYDGAVHGHFTGTITEYKCAPCVRRNLPEMWLATVVVNEYGSTVTLNYDRFNEAYGD